MESTPERVEILLSLLEKKDPKYPKRDFMIEIKHVAREYLWNKYSPTYEAKEARVLEVLETAARRLINSLEKQNR